MGGDGCQEKPERLPCEPCRTINLARAKEKKPYMQMYDKCRPPEGPCMPVSEMPCPVTCIKVCNKEEFLKCTCKQPVKVVLPHVGHGPFMYLVKAGILSGAVYFFYRQGVWGDQQDVTECIRRWGEYFRSFNTRRAPNFDRCGKVIVKESSDTALAPIYAVYKSMVTTAFAGIIKFPTIVKCMYLDYVEKMRLREIEAAKERKIRKKSI